MLERTNFQSARPSDAEDALRRLMVCALDGDRVAYAALLTTLRGYLATYFERRLRTAPGDVEDLVQDTLLTLHEKRHTYDRGQLLTPWVFAIARYKLLNHLRRTGRRASVPIDEANELPDLHNPVEGAIRHDLARLLGWLAPRQRRLVEATKVTGHSVAEVADRMGMTPGAVKASVHRSLKDLAARSRHDD